MIKNQKNKNKLKKVNKTKNKNLKNVIKNK